MTMYGFNIEWKESMTTRKALRWKVVCGRSAHNQTELALRAKTAAALAIAAALAAAIPATASDTWYWTGLNTTPAGSGSASDWGLDVNLKGAVYFARALMPQMVAKKGGVICCLGSVTGFEGDGVGTMYGTAKSGLFNFVKGLALAGGPHNVRALCVTPDPVLTRAAMSGMPTALGRAAETRELVDVILFMCSDNASFVTGTNHVIDGGRLCMYQPFVAPMA